MYSIKDIIKKSFLEGFSQTGMDPKTAIVVMLITLCIGIYIFMLYRVICRKGFYNSSFNLSLVGVALITAAIILTIQSSVIVSLGMVGALSIVRFRTAVKDPMDLMFMFWSISTGIICGAGFAEYALILAVTLTVAVLVLNAFPVTRAPFLLVVNMEDNEKEQALLDVVREKSTYFKVKGRVFSQKKAELTIEVRTKDGGELVNAVNKLSGITSAALICNEGESTF
ncbi:MAG: DUF4956 domain-containing protein [Lachnospiraceae bacterium]|nr:DUF4956 domain-containing protein [Lachnospiraceae bacterium]